VLAEDCFQSPPRTNDRALSVERGMGFQPVQRSKVQPFGNAGSLALIGTDVDPFSIADLIERYAMREILGHPILPCPSSPVSERPSLVHKSRSFDSQWAIASGLAGSPR